MPPGVTNHSSSYTGRLTCDIRADSALEEATLGGRVLTIPKCTLTNLPRRWKLPAAEHDIDDADFAAAGGAPSEQQLDSASLAALADDPVENPFKYVLTIGLPGRSIHFANGSLKYNYPGRPAAATAASIALSGGPPTRPNTPGTATGRPATPAASGSKAAAGPASGGKAAAADPKAKAGSKPSTANGERKEDASVPEPAVAAAVGNWVVEFRESKAFVGRDGLDAFTHKLQSGQLIDGAIRRVSTEPIEDDDAEETIYPLEGRRLLEEDYSHRASVSFALDSLLLPGVMDVVTEVNVVPVPVSDAEKAAEAEKKAARDAAWASLQAEKAKSAAATGVKGKVANAKSPPAAKPGAPGKAAAAAPAKGTPGGKAVDPKAKPGAKGAVAAVPEPETPAPPAVHPYDAAGTILSFAVNVNEALIQRPPTPPPVQQTVEELIPQRGPALPAPPALDASQEFRREVANAVTAVAKEYSALISRAGGDIDAALPLDERRKQLLSRLKEGGHYDGIKQALQRCASNIVRERFVHMPGYNDPLGSAGKDELFSHVYAYLVGQMHAALNATFSDADTVAPAAFAVQQQQQRPATSSTASPPSRRSHSRGGSRPGTRGGVVLPPGSSSSSILDGGGSMMSTFTDAAASSAAAGAPVVESPILRLRRVAIECEFTGHYERAARVHQTRVALVEEAAARGQTGGKYDPCVWYEYGIFCMRRGELLKAATCLRESLSCDPKFTPALLALASLQCARGKADEAQVFCSTAVNVLKSGAAVDIKAYEKIASSGTGPQEPLVSENNNTLPLAHAIHSFALQLAGKNAESGTALNAAVSSLSSLYAERGAADDDVNRSATAGAAYLILSRYLLDLHLGQLARKSIEQAHSALLDTDAPRIQRVDILTLRVRLYLQSMNVLDAHELREYAPTKGGTTSTTGVMVRQPSRLDNLPGASMQPSEGGASASSSAASSTIAFGGKAYDGAILAAEEASKTILRACEMSNLVAESWFLRSVMCLAGLNSHSRKKSVTGVDTSMPGAPDLGDLEVEDLTDGRRYLELAVGNYEAPQHAGYLLLSNSSLHPMSTAARAAHITVGPSGSQSSSPTLQLQQPNGGARADNIFASFSGVGGGNLASDEFGLVRLFMRLSTAQLQLAAVEDATTAAAVLQSAKDSYIRAVQAGRACASACPGVYGGPWCSAWLGVGRATWAQNSPLDAEIVLGEANALDNQNPVVWAWLAYLCLCAEPLRDREAAAALDQALKNVSIDGRLRAEAVSAFCVSLLLGWHRW